MRMTKGNSVGAGEQTGVGAKGRGRLKRWGWGYWKGAAWLTRPGV